MTRKKVLLALVLVVSVACATTPTQVAYRTVGLTVHTVDTGMKMWADYVVAGHATADQEAKVRAAHDRYRTVAHDLEIGLTATNPAPTPEQLQAAAIALVNLIEQFTHKTVAGLVQPGWRHA